MAATAIRPRPGLTRAAQWFHALSDETRLRIVRLLAQREQCVCDLTGALDAAQSRLSFHLKTLKDAGLVADRREGRWVYYSLRPEALDGVIDFAQAVQNPGRRLEIREDAGGEGGVD